MTNDTHSVERFSGLATGYDRYRPGYPEAAVAYALAGLPVRPEVIDVGAGTGISSRALLDAGARVVAIEPNAEMRTIALANGIDARDGRADATGVPDACADLVAAFQAFHWFTDRSSLAEFERVLRPSGRVALVWNVRDTCGDAFTRDVRAIEKRYANPRTLAGADFYDATLDALLSTAGFARIRRESFANQQRLDRAGLLGRIASGSYMPRTGDELQRTRDELVEIHARYADAGGFVTMRYRVDVILGER